MTSRILPAILGRIIKVDMYVSSIEIKDFRGFEHASVDLVHPTGSRRGSKKKKSNKGDDSYLPNVTLLIGVNGAGKTSILKAIAMSVLVPVIQDSGYRPYHLVRKQGSGLVADSAQVSAQICLHGQDVGNGFAKDSGIVSNPSAEISVVRSYERVRPSREFPEMQEIFDDESPAYFMVGYGATRRVEDVDNLNSQTEKRRSVRYQRVAGLFEDYITLYPMEAWLRGDRHPGIGTLIRDLLDPVGVNFYGQSWLIDPRNIDLPLRAFSDGYRAYIGLLMDLIYHLQSCCPVDQQLVDMAGVVLIDDIDLHLHPKWQREVVHTIATAFPRLQFILTSHSPLVAGSLHERNVRVIEDGCVREFQERLHGLNADQVLTSSYFGLNSTRSVEMEDRLKELELDVSKRGDPDAAIAYLRELTLEEKNGEH